MTPGVGTGDRVTTRRLFARGWRTWMPVVIGNAAVQAATTVPFATPAVGAVFLALAVVSLLALVVSVVLVLSQSAASAAGVHWRAPSRRLWIAGAAAVLVTGVAAVVLAPLLLLSTTAALIMLPAIAAGAGAFTGFRVFAAFPLHAIGLTIISILALLLLWLGALLSGFFITGALSAALTWLVLGSVGVVLAASWTTLVRRSVSSTVVV